MRKSRLVKIHAAAYHFASISRNIQNIADALDVSTDAIRKWEKTPEWGHALKVLDYTGTRDFEKAKTRDTQRDAADFDKVRTAYREAQRQGVANHKLATVVGEKTGVSVRKVRDWAREHGWRNGGETPSQRLF